jgi:hypothetical protein
MQVFWFIGENASRVGIDGTRNEINLCVFFNQGGNIKFYGQTWNGIDKQTYAQFGIFFKTSFMGTTDIESI